jgi:antirestriction protein ArdC
MEANNLIKMIDTTVDHLVEKIDEAKQSEAMLSFLKMASRFHKYSTYNLLLIYSQMPDASRIAGYKTWQSMGRYVRKGQRGIHILVPVFFTKAENGIAEDEKNEKKIKYFNTGAVFDVSQTDGATLPEEPEWRSREKAPEIEQALLMFAKNKGITVNITTEIPIHGAEGVSMGNKILLLPDAGTRTLIHELAHELLHKGPCRDLDTQTKEIEADATAYVVCDHFHIVNNESPNYLGLYQATGKEVMGRLGSIRAASAEIIQAVEELLTPTDKSNETTNK